MIGQYTSWPSCSGLSRLRGRSRFGEAKARASTFFLADVQDVDGRDEPGHDETEVPSASEAAR
jgi:hypothetical protein